MPATTTPIFPAFDGAACRLDAGHFAVFAFDARNLALFENIDAECVGRTREAPGNRIVPRNPGAALQRSPEDRIARRRRRIDNRNCFLDLLRSHDLGIDAVQPIRRDASLDIAHVLQSVTEVVDAALAEHDVVVQVLAETFPKFERLLIEQRCLGPEIIGTHDRRVATGVTAADPAFLEHGNIRDPMLFRQVVGRRQSMPAAADNDDIVFTLRLRATPCLGPAAIVAKRIFQQAES